VAHGGKITAESEGPGRGSRFTVRLPRLSTPSVSDSAAPPARPRAAVCRRVLLVDDNEDSCEMLQFFLESYGHEARLAHDGVHALALVESFAPEIVFLDIGLPGMDGYEVVGRMRQIPACAKIPIIALSGYSSPADRRRALAAGFSDHLAKPVDPTVLAEVVEKGMVGAVKG
jgi:CheY-like chemotaxis protein